jgi:hypothetical protein
MKSTHLNSDVYQRIDITDNTKTIKNTPVQFPIHSALILNENHKTRQTAWTNFPGNTRVWIMKQNTIVHGGIPFFHIVYFPFAFAFAFDIAVVFKHQMYVFIHDKTTCF